jgi:hypothetical protein
MDRASSFRGHVVAPSRRFQRPSRLRPRARTNAVGGSGYGTRVMAWCTAKRPQNGLMREASVESGRHRSGDGAPNEPELLE